MQRDGQHGLGLLAQGLEVGDHAGGRDGDPPARDGDALVVGQDVDGLGDVVQIVQRLAHAHEHDVRELALLARRGPLGEVVAGHLDLGHDLGRRQVAHQGLGPGVAEGAVQGAAHLAGDAERALSARHGDVGNEHRLHLDARGEADQPLARPVLGDLALHDLGAGDGEALGEGGAGFLGDVAHRFEGGGAGLVDPAPQLARAHLRLLGRHDPGLRQGGAQRLAAEAGEVDPGIRGRDVGARAGDVEGDAQGARL